MRPSGVIIVLAAVAAILAGGDARPAAAIDTSHFGRYTNCVLAGETATGALVVLTAGNHTDFPIAGIDWDNLVLRVGRTGYVFTEVGARTRALAVGIARAPGASWGWLWFDGDAATVPLGGGGVAVVDPTTSAAYPRAHVRLVVLARASSLVDRIALPGAPPPSLPFLTWDLEGVSATLAVDGRDVPLRAASFAGHIERGDPLVMNVPDPAVAANLPFYLVYDYEAAARPGGHGAAKVQARGRIVGRGPLPGGLALPPVWLPLRGQEPLLDSYTDLVGVVRLGPLVLERRLVTFNNSDFLNFFFRARRCYGLKEVFRWGL